MGSRKAITRSSLLRVRGRMGKKAMRLLLKEAIHIKLSSNTMSRALISSLIKKLCLLSRCPMPSL